MQQIVIDEESPSKLPIVRGGTPEVYPKPLLFLVFINDLPAAVSSKTRLFADDCILYRSIRRFSDCETPQNDLGNNGACNSTLPNVTLYLLQNL